MNITNQISEAINEVSNQESEELLACLAQEIIKSVKYCDYPKLISIKMSAKEKQKYCKDGNYKNLEKILDQCNFSKLERLANKLGMNFTMDIENAQYCFYFNFYPDKKPQTKVEILAHKINKHYKKLKQKIWAIAKKNSRIEYLSKVAIIERKASRQQSYEVYRECIEKLLKRKFEVDSVGKIIIRLDGSIKFDMLRLNKFLRRTGLKCVQQQFNIVWLLQLQPTQK